MNALKSLMLAILILAVAISIALPAPVSHAQETDNTAASPEDPAAEPESTTPDSESNTPEKRPRFIPREFTLLSAKAFPDLPEPVANYLKERFLLIPQSFMEYAPHNVLSGDFTGDGRTDWAVLCGDSCTATLRVFWDGDVQRIDEVAQFGASFIDIGGDGRQGYCGKIYVADKEKILKYHEWYHQYSTEPAPAPKIERVAIELAYLEKASTVYYWDGKKWLDLPGID